MANSPIDWTSAIVMLTAGIIVGAIFVYITVRSRGAAAAGPIDRELERRDLEAKGDALIQQLREIEDTAGRIAPHELAHQRYEIEIQAAHVWQQLDGMTKSGAAPKRAAATDASAGREGVVAAPPATGFLAQYPALRGFAWGVLSIGVLVGLFYFVSKSSQQRGEGGSVTGGTGMEPVGGGSQQQAAANDPEVQQARAAVEKDPGNDDARLELARVSLIREDLMEAFNQTETVLKRSPKNAKALTYQSFVRLAMGQADNALKMLQQATGYQPDLIDAWIQMAMVYTQMGRDKEADAALNKAIQLRPDQKAQMEALLAQWRQSRDAASAAPSQPAGGMGSAPAAAVAGDDPTAVSGTVELDPSIKSLPEGATLYIMAREAGVAGGPPTAVEKLIPGQFPIAFTVGVANSMMGQGLPPKVRVEARIDFDGNAMTREPGDPIAVIDPVSAGTKGVKLVLKRP